MASRSVTFFDSARSMQPFAVIAWLLTAAIGFGQETSVAPENYKLAPGDSIEIEVLPVEADLPKREARLSPEGNIQFPLIGEVRIAGLTAREAGAKIRTLLEADYLVSPQVHVALRQLSRRRFTILGEVRSPGSYEIPIEGKLTILDAIAMAGGPSEFADTGRVSIKRKNSQGEQILKINAKRMQRQTGAEPTRIEPDDIITIPQGLF